MSQLEAKPRSLGTGLNTLFQNNLPMSEKEEFLKMSIDCLRPGKFQPRQTFDPDEMQELVDSIKQHGILQPILVRLLNEHQFQFEIIAGERRWQAAKQAGLKTVPVWIREISDKQALEMAIVENIQRQDLNLIEEALAYKRLIDEFGYTHETVAESVKKSRSYITNAIRLLTLPEKVQESVRKNLISASHARALIRMENAEELAEQIEKNQINVRQTEALKKQKKFENKPGTQAKNADLLSIEENLTQLLQMPVTVTFKNDGGDIKIKFATLEQLDQLVECFSSHKSTVN